MRQEVAGPANLHLLYYILKIQMIELACYRAIYLVHIIEMVNSRYKCLYVLIRLTVLRALISKSKEKFQPLPQPSIHNRFDDALVVQSFTTRRDTSSFHLRNVRRDLSEVVGLRGCGVSAFRSINVRLALREQLPVPVTGSVSNLTFLQRPSLSF
jgi:hypothetical protein